MALIPIGTDIRTRKPPLANWALIALNVAVFVFTDYLGGEAGRRIKTLYMLDPVRPFLYQYITYQFLHGDVIHLIGNMLFLWIFGHGVCDRMGSLCYTIFYLAGGVFAGVGFSYGAQNPILGASGAIAAVTTAFLVLFPRVHVTMLFWFFLITTFQLPAMILIVFKIILWDNIIAPRFEHGATSNVAYSAHLAGYAFGFAVATFMLLTRALPRNQFDLLALWGRWRRRAGLPGAAEFAAPRSARPVVVEEVDSRPIEPLKLSPAEALREEALDALSTGDAPRAVDTYLRLLELDPNLVLPRPQQIEIANLLAQSGRRAEAARAYEAFLAAYPNASDASQVRLLLGLIYRRYLRQSDAAARHLRQALEGLTLDSQRQLALDELRLAEAQPRAE